MTISKTSFCSTNIRNGQTSNFAYSFTENGSLSYVITNNSEYVKLPRVTSCTPLKLWKIILKTKMKSTFIWIITHYILTVKFTAFANINDTEIHEVIMIKPRCLENETVFHTLFCNDKLKCKDGIPIQDVYAEWQICESLRNSKTQYCVVERDEICKEKVVCSNMNPCDARCDSHYKCQNSECKLRSTVCNKNACDGCTEEDHEWNNGIGFKCRRNDEDCVLPQQLIHDDIADCDGGADLCFEAQYHLNNSLRTELQHREHLHLLKCFMCLNDVTVIASTSVCDGIIDCPDLSDECLCDKSRPRICEQVISYDENGFISLPLVASPTTESGLTMTWFSSGKYTDCNVGNVICAGGYCINPESVCDGTIDCRDDEGCSRGSHTCVNIHGVACDSVADCHIGPPSWGSIISAPPFPDDECRARCFETFTNFTCNHDAIHAAIQMVGVAEEYISCEHHLELDANQSIIITKHLEKKFVCDGKLHCPQGDDEKNCDRFLCDGEEEGVISIEFDKVCDGIEHCKNGSDESIELCAEKRFHCPALGGKKVSIDVGLKCDFLIACDDATDEMNCTDGRFYCENKKPLFVLAKQKFDGRGDCTDWSDECPTIDQSTSTDGFSSRYELIANPILRAVVWIMGLLSLGGNGVVIFHETRRLRNSNRKLTAIVIANRLLILNLAFSDVIMGIYLLSLGIAGLAMQGVYCSRDLIWRSSAACTTLGILSVISSETSVITMVLLTSCRLYAIFKPFKSSRHPKMKIVSFMILIAWTISFLIAILPLSSHLSGMFVSHAEFEYSPYSSNATVTLDETKSLFTRLLTYDLKPNMTFPDKFSVNNFQSWQDIESESTKYFLHKHFKIQKKFGYYSVDSVCIPKFFVTKDDRAWPFSFFVNLFNFCAFVFVASSYVAIYIKSREGSKFRRTASRAEKDDGNRSLQRKILRLIITDFCCWIPICILAFCKLGGANVSNTAYVVAAIVLLPINSALNPVLYSDLPDALYKKLSEKFHGIVNLPSSRSTMSTAVNGRTDIEESEL
uniref:G-protein coupled receptor GRL101-like isoform X2 n=1 Tax=Styela clava TaxID=7725 RepID=UPI001939571C|nr:G-protein coupled receptor GRL101-like isoform X2 [Styela clava]